MSHFSIFDLPENFLERIMPEPMSGCWLWIGFVDPNGYGRSPIRSLLGRQAHRIVYCKLVRYIPNGKQLDHLCRLPSCVNPSHLEPVTNQENVKRGIRNQYTQKTHCPQGHPYAGYNLKLYRRKNGKIGRNCRTCNNETLRRWKMKKGLIPHDGSDLTPRQRSYSCKAPSPSDRVAFENLKITDSLGPTSKPAGRMVCCICRTSFEYSHSRVKYCGKECYRESERRNQRERKRRRSIAEEEKHAFS
jgi:hypothetical protein